MVLRFTSKKIMNNNGLRKNAILNMIKQGCAIVFPFITFSYASRILGVEQMGGYTFAQSIVSYFSLIAALGIKEYAVREGAFVRDKMAKLNTFANEIFSINMLFTAMAYLLLGILIFLNQNISEYRYMIMIQSLSILLTTLGAEWINLIYEDFYYITVRYIIINVLAVLLLLIFVRTPNDIYKYILIVMIASYGGNIVNLFYIRKKIKVKFTFKFKFSTHIKALSILFCNSIASVVYLNSDITLIGIFLNDAQVGTYSAASKIYTMIKTMINALIMAAIPRASRMLAEKGKKEYDDMISYILKCIFIITLPLSTGIVLKSKNIIYFVLGDKYLGGVPALKILSWALPFAICAYLFSCVVLIPNHLEKKYMYSTVTGASINIILNFIFIPNYGISGAAITTLFAECIVCILCCYHSRNILKIHLDVRLIGAVIVGSIEVCGICLLMDLLVKQLILNLFASIFMSAIFYACIIYTCWKKALI